MTTRARFLLGLSFALAATPVVACDLNPQPLPPGDQADGSTAAAPGNGAGGTQSSGDAATPPLAASDAGVAAGDASIDATPEPAPGDGGSDGQVDGAADGASDATFDAGDAPD